MGNYQDEQTDGFEEWPSMKNVLKGMVPKPADIVVSNEMYTEDELDQEFVDFDALKRDAFKSKR